MNHKSMVTLLQNLFFSESKPADLKPIDLSLVVYLLLRQTEDHFIHDSQLTLANRLGCERRAIADSVKRLVDLGWIVSKAPWQWNEKTKRKTRRIGGTVGLTVNLSKLPQSGDRSKHSKPSPDAVKLASKHTALLIKLGLSKRQHKNFDSQQEHAAQRLIEEMGGYLEAIAVLNFALKDKRYKGAAQKSLYELRSRLSTIRPAFEAVQRATVESA